MSWISFGVDFIGVSPAYLLFESFSCTSYNYCLDTRFYLLLSKSKLALEFVFVGSSFIDELNTAFDLFCERTLSISPFSFLMLNVAARRFFLILLCSYSTNFMSSSAVSFVEGFYCKSLWPLFKFVARPFNGGTSSFRKISK